MRTFQRQQKTNRKESTNELIVNQTTPKKLKTAKANRIKDQTQHNTTQHNNMTLTMEETLNNGSSSNNQDFPHETDPTTNSPTCQRRRMKKRNACVFETTKTWKHLNVDGRHDHEITAHWEGLLTGKLVVLVDGKVACIQTRDQQDYNPTDPYGHFYVDGHELEFVPTSSTLNALGDSSMNLTVDGRTFMEDDGDQRITTHDLEIAEAARAVAHLVPPFEYDD